MGSNTPSPVATNPSFPLHCTIVGAQGVCNLVIIDTKKRETVIKQSIDGATEGFDLGMSGYLLGNVSYVGSTDGEINEHEAKKDLKITDLTGAGDLFASGFLHGCLNNLSTKESLAKGTEMSSKIIQKVGARLN